MQQPSPIDPHVPRNKPWLYLTIGFIAGIVVTVGCLAIAAGAYFLVNSMSSEETPALPDAHVELRVAHDGCTVKRGEVSGKTPVTSLTWAITNPEGHLVLDRAAEGEYEYKYFGAGKYSVQIKAWYNGAYHPISDPVEIDC